MTEVKDHLGNIFPTIKAMCEHWNVPYNLFTGRVHQGWTYERALTEKKGLQGQKKEATDHLGNHFSSENKMCDYWGISYASYKFYLSIGKTKEEALMHTPSSRSGIEFTDHEGNHFSSMKEMANYWGVKYTTLNSRLKRGHTIKESLLAGSDHVAYIPKEKRTDHLGITYPSIVEMCKHWNVDPELLTRRLQQGFALADILEHRSYGKYEDHLGNKFLTIKAMAEYWNISYPTLAGRFARKFKGEELIFGRKKFVDHLGNKFESVKAMANYWGLSYGVLSDRLKSGYSLKDILENNGDIKPEKFSSSKTLELKKLNEGWSVTEVLSGHRKISTLIKQENGYLDPMGNWFKSINDLCNHWNINPSTFTQRLIRGVRYQDAFYPANSKQRKKKYSSNQIVTESIDSVPDIKDFCGNEYQSIEELCAKWKISVEYYTDKIKHNWNQEKILKKPEYIDPLGHKFRYMKELCRAWNINYQRFWYQYKRKKITIGQAIFVCRNSQY